eukprot:TRINITY_DN3426_c0_g1_i6.p1 TRINITY_DN3426_c0_g1~~TRINITY_DN3426_c0_g1_i6.p1  ORF type:complete len:235 (-),score=51.40 TRINITY_DN3426_c0_g1_i6:276-980(-)
MHISNSPSNMKVLPTTIKGTNCIIIDDSGLQISQINKKNNQMTTFTMQLRDLFNNTAAFPTENQLGQLQLGASLVSNPGVSYVGNWSVEDAANGIVRGHYKVEVGGLYHVNIRLSQNPGNAKFVPGTPFPVFFTALMDSITPNAIPVVGGGSVHVTGVLFGEGLQLRFHNPTTSIITPNCTVNTPNSMSCIPPAIWNATHVSLVFNAGQNTTSTLPFATYQLAAIYPVIKQQVL